MKLNMKICLHSENKNLIKFSLNEKISKIFFSFNLRLVIFKIIPFAPLLISFLPRFLLYLFSSDED